MARRKILVAMMMHETNTFSPVPTPLASFRPLSGPAAAQLSIRVLELLDGRGPGEGAERGQGRGDGRKRIGLVHHHRDENLAAGHGPSSQVSRMGYAARAYRRLGGCAVPHRG